MAPSSEFDTIRRYFAPLCADVVGAYNLANDAAVWRPRDGFEAVITTDCMVAGVHFLADDPPGSIAAKLLAVNLSDIAAMGATPAVYTVATAWPSEIGEDWIAAFAKGLGAVQAVAGIMLIGGDTVSTPGPMVLTLTAVGEVAIGKALTRSGARAGDDVYVTGTIGDAALGLRVLRGAVAPTRGEDAEYLIGRYRMPTPRSVLGASLPGVASSAIDVSDGLAQDIGHLARESGVGITLNRDLLPVSQAMTRALVQDESLWGSVFGGGDDYELAFTSAPANADKLMKLSAASGTPLARIGTVGATGESGAVVRFEDSDGIEIPVAHAGYRHF
jgi:thiamine-monophosphate kinase